MSIKTKNIILCMAANYQFNDLIIFLNSLSYSGFNGELYIITDLAFDNSKYPFTIKPIKFKNSLTTNNRMSKFFINKIIFSKPLRKLILKSLFFLNNSLFLNIYTEHSHIYLRRFAIYLSAIRNIDCTNVFITDLRDVFFLQSPFKGDENIPLTFFGENEELFLKNEYFNSMWIKNMYGDSIINSFENQIIFNMGTILGNRTDLIKFMKDIIKESLNHKFYDAVFSQDQGILNYLISKNKWPNAQKSTNGQLVFTAGTIKEGDIKIENKEIYYKGEKLNASIVHQYDRSFSLTEYSKNFY